MNRVLYVVCFILVAVLCAAPVSAFKDLDVEKIEALALKGDPVAQTKMGVIYSRGLLDKVDIDKDKAVMWYQKAADQGYVNAQWNLAFMHVRGEGVKKDLKKARDLFRKAAEQGYAPAEYDLGMMSLYGMGGKRSRSEALKWVRKAADQDYKEAIGFLRSQGEYEEKMFGDKKKSENPKGEGAEKEQPSM